MIKEIKTESGFECEIEMDLFNDADILDYMIASEEGDTLQFAKMMKLLLGGQQYNKAKDFIRDEHGKAPLTKLFELFTEIILSTGKDGKNS